MVPLQKQELPFEMLIYHHPDRIKLIKTVFIFHNESTFQANEDQPTLWAEKGTSVMRLNSKGSEIMVSDFIEEKHGYHLALTKEEYDKEKTTEPDIQMYAREFWSMVKLRMGTGHMIDSSNKSRRPLKLLISSTRRVKVRELYGSLIIAAAMQQWLMIHWM